MSSAPNKSQPIVAPVFAVRFDPSEVACIPARLEQAVATLRTEAQREGWMGDQCRETLRGMPPLTDVEAVHRHLIARVKQTYGWSRADTQRALQRVREHSTLYTPRRCTCLRQAWSRFGEELEQQLQTIASPTGTWATTLDGAPTPDRFGAPTTQDVATVAGLGSYGLNAVSLHKRLPYMYVRAWRGPGEVWRLEVRFSVGRRTRVVALSEVPVDREWLASAVRCGGPLDVRASHRVLHASAELASAAVALGRGGRDVWAARRSFDDLEALDFDAQPVEHRKVAARLAVGWTGTMRELIAVSATVST